MNRQKNKLHAALSPEFSYERKGWSFLLKLEFEVTEFGEKFKLLPIRKLLKCFNRCLIMLSKIKFESYVYE